MSAEPRHLSGTALGPVMQFRPLANEPAALMAQVFSLTVPNTDTSLPADSPGRRQEFVSARHHPPPLPTMIAKRAAGRQRTVQDMGWAGLCVDGGGAEQLNSREATPARKGCCCLISAPLSEWADFANANPDGSAWMHITLTGCSDE